MTASKIEWTDRSDWNAIRGCTRVSPGCGGPGKQGGCYAESMAARFSKPGQWGHGIAEMRNGSPHWTGKVELQEDRVTLPLRWKKPARIFVSSTSDVFHEALPDAAIDKLFAIMALCPQHTFQVLTKRAKRMQEYCRDRSPWPLPNIWFGVSCEDQERADERIPLLLQTPAAVRFISAEPLIGPIEIDRLRGPDDPTIGIPLYDTGALTLLEGLDWVITGGESGRHARPMHPGWARSFRDQCNASGIPYFHKQNGEYASVSEVEGEGAHHRFDDGCTVRRVGKRAAGRLLDGVEHSAFPERRP